MRIIDMWRTKIETQRAKDVDIEQQTRMPTTGQKDWVTPADIQRLEEQMVPWLRNKRRQAARQARKT